MSLLLLWTVVTIYQRNPPEWGISEWGIIPQSSFLSFKFTLGCKNHIIQSWKK